MTLRFERRIKLDLRNADFDSRTIPAVISSDSPVERVDERGIGFTEILSHADGAIDLRRAPLPLIESHDSGEVNIAIVENLRSDGKKLRANIRFGKSKRAKEVLRDVRDKVIRYLSVGYRIDAVSDPFADVRVVTRWTPFEASIVSTPADTSAQFFRNNEMKSKIQTKTGETNDTKLSRRQRNKSHTAVLEERERVKSINFAVSRYPELNLREMADGYIDDGRSAAEFGNAVLDKLPGAQQSPEIYSPETFEYGGTARKRDSNGLKAPCGFYNARTGEPLRAWTRKTKVEDMRSNLDPEQVKICEGLTFGHFLRAIQFGPRNDREKRVLSIGTPSAGGYTVPEPLMLEFIDNLRNEAVVLAAGGVIVPMGSKTLDIARLDTDPTPTWRAENAAVSQSDAVFSQVRLNAQDLSVEVLSSRELAQDSINLEAALTQSFIRTFAIELDRVALVGSGVDPEPEGVLNAVGVTEIDLGAATMTRYQSLVALRRDVQRANGKPTAWVMNNTTQSELAGLEATDNQPLIAPAYYSELATFATEGVPDDDGAGADESPVFIGNWSDLLVGIREGTEIQLNPFLRAGNGQVSWFVHLRADIQLVRPASFGRIIGNTGVV